MITIRRSINCGNARIGNNSPNDSAPNREANVELVLSLNRDRNEAAVAFGECVITYYRYVHSALQKGAATTPISLYVAQRVASKLPRDSNSPRTSADLRSPVYSLPDRSATLGVHLVR